MVGGDRRIPSYGGDYRYAREDKDVDVQLLLFESFGGFTELSASPSPFAAERHGNRRAGCE